MGTGGWIALGVGVVALGGGVVWWIHSTSKAAVTPGATKIPSNSGWVGTVTGVSSAAKDLSGAFVNVTQGISNLEN